MNWIISCSITLVVHVLYVLSVTVDREHYKSFYAKHLDNQNIRDRRGSPYPYYEWKIKQHENDKRIHAEVSREHQGHQKEYEKQYQESKNESQQTNAQRTETTRETTTNAAEKSSNQKRNKGKEVYL